jgi:hypothetical protein
MLPKPWGRLPERVGTTAPGGDDLAQLASEKESGRAIQSPYQGMVGPSYLALGRRGLSNGISRSFHPE